jgi:RHS repeat-associated protein
MTDSTGTVVWTAVYEPFGKATVTVNTVENNLRSIGQYFDRETNLHYNYFRDYDPTTGRYTEFDLIGLRGGLNGYAYALGNPLSYTDPLGLDVFLCSQPALGWAPVDHQWIKTDSVEAGMGGTRGNVPGNQSGDLPGDPVQVTDHSGRSKEQGASCKEVPNVDEKKVNDQLKIGRPLGRWTPGNQCQSFAKGVLNSARNSPGASGSWSKGATGGW